MLKKFKWKQYIEPTLHILVWASLFLFIWYNANTIGPFRKQDGSIYPPLLWSTAASVALFYGNALYLIPRFISKQRYQEYLLWVIPMYIAIVVLNSVLDDSYVLSLTSSEKEPLLATIILNIQSKLVILSLSLGYGLARQWNINEKIKQKLIRERLAAELKYLKAQINPHFLFNTLNMAYASAIKSNDNGTADIIEKLSVLMRYALYESNEDKVSLEKEMSYIDNYIKLQLQRLSPEIASQINYSAKGDWRNLTIAPMILIPYIENVFKHGIIVTKKSDVVITITLTPDSLLLETKNDVNKLPNNKRNNNSGIGMQNAKERLQLLYPNQHHLKFETVDGMFMSDSKYNLNKVPMKCIAIDDEPFALELISDYIRKTPFLEFVGGFTNPFQGMEFLLKNEVDFLFLDINMPELSGIELLKSLPNIPKVIFTTAYAEFGAESYDFNTIDYLIKPIRYDRFLKAVNKANDTNALFKKNVAPTHTPEQDKEAILIKSGSQLIQLVIDDIYFIEGAGNYITLYTKNKKIMVLLTMGEIVKILPSHLFVRIHKSFIVALKHIEIIEKVRVIVNKKVIPIGITYREHFSKIISNE